MADPLVITITDVRRAGYCGRGVKAWCERQDIDFRGFLKNGIDAERLLATRDAMAERVVALKRGG